MPILVLAARLCPPGMEATMYAVIMSVSNLGGPFPTNRKTNQFVFPGKKSFCKAKSQKRTVGSLPVFFLEATVHVVIMSVSSLAGARPGPHGWNRPFASHAVLRALQTSQKDTDTRLKPDVCKPDVCKASKTACEANGLFCLLYKRRVAGTHSSGRCCNASPCGGTPKPQNTNSGFHTQGCGSCGCRRATVCLPG